MSNDLFDLKYPIGKYAPPKIITENHISDWIASIEQLPDKFIKASKSLTQEQLDTPYRPGGWTLRQVIHHVPDSHVNSYIRFKWALTENNPIIKAYEEASWSELKDTKNAPIDVSLDFLQAIHKKLVVLLKSLSPDELKRTFVHPESGNIISLDWNIGLYAWHGEHHLAHLKLVAGKN
jgi:hypothetical protein